MRFTQKMIQWLSKNVPGNKYYNIVPLFNKKFNTTFALEQIKDACKYRGIRTGRLGKKRLMIGTERSFGKKPGIVYIKISERQLPKLYTKKTMTGTWRQKHILIWEKSNGALPKGYIVIFADADRNNFNIENLLLVSKKEHQYMCRFRLYDKNPDITKVNLLVVRHRFLIIDRIRQITGNRRHYSFENKCRKKIMEVQNERG